MKDVLDDNLLEEPAAQYSLFEPESKPNSQEKFTFIDLFAGIGGFRIAMQNLGGKCIFSSEWDELLFLKNLIFYVLVFLVRHFLLQENVEGLKILEGLCFLMLQKLYVAISPKHFF